MTTFREECALLAPLETFNPAAFRADERVPQEVCNFVLSLALIFNDCKDVLYAHIALAESEPEPPARRNRAWGAQLGIWFHVLRAIFGVVHELLELIKKNGTSIDHPFFQSLLRRLRPDAREAWQALAMASSDAAPPSATRVVKILLLVRHKMASHYDPRAIFVGYNYHFAVMKPDERAFISRGDSMQESRFYFADAAATGYFNSVVDPGEAEQTLREIVEALKSTNLALFGIVESFIQARGHAYRPQAEE